MITIAIDASTKSTGVAVFKNKELVKYMAFELKAKMREGEVKFKYTKNC